METRELLQDENRYQPLTACWDLPVWVESKEEYLWENEVNMNMLTDGKPLLFWLLRYTHELSALSVTICTSLYIHGGPQCSVRQDLEQLSVANVWNVGSWVYRIILKNWSLSNLKVSLGHENDGARRVKRNKKVVLCVCVRQALAHQYIWLKVWQTEKLV